MTIGDALRAGAVLGGDFRGARHQLAADLQGNGRGRLLAPARDHGFDPIPVGCDGPVRVGLV